MAMIEWLDETCGDLMEQLNKKGVADNTLVLYLADNGWNEYGKAHPYENGVRTPFIAHWPGKIKPRKDERQLVSNVDGDERHTGNLNRCDHDPFGIRKAYLK